MRGIATIAAIGLGLVLFWGARAGWCAGGPEFDMAAEGIGALRLDMPAAEVLAATPCPPAKGREVFEAASGDYVQTWTMPACGLELKMRGERKGGPKTVGGIEAKAPCDLPTAKGIRIGSPEKDVVAAYGRFRDKDGASRPGKTFVAGSIYGGLMFTIKNGRVAGMFLGAAAE